MEEYFPPIGTDHQILDGREAHPRAWLFIFCSALVALFLLTCTLGWWKQRTYSFTIPDETLTLDYSRTALRAIKEEQRITIPNAWKETLPAGILPRIVGGTSSEPRWMLAPRWARVPDGWHEGESYGLYQLLVGPGARTTARNFQLRERASWSLGLNHRRIRGQIHTERQDILFAINDRVLKTSLAASAPTSSLLPGHDASYILQNSAADDGLLNRLVFRSQGLAPWRQEIKRLAWDTPTGTLVSWSLEVHSATSTLVQLLTNTSTTNRVSLLADGSASIRQRISTTSNATTIVNSGTSQATTLPSCAEKDFHPFFHLSGASLVHTWSRISDQHPMLLQIGELDGHLSVCFTERVDVDK